MPAGDGQGSCPTLLLPAPVEGVGEGKTAWQDARGDPKGCVCTEGGKWGQIQLVENGLWLQGTSSPKAEVLPAPHSYPLSSFSLVRQGSSLGER